MFMVTEVDLQLLFCLFFVNLPCSVKLLAVATE